MYIPRVISLPILTVFIDSHTIISWSIRIIFNRSKLFIEYQFIKYFFFTVVKRKSLNKNHKLWKILIVIKNEFKNVSSKRWNKKPDLLIIHNTKYYNPLKRKNVLCSPIGIEFKKSKKCINLLKGICQLERKYNNEDKYTYNN